MIANEMLSTLFGGAGLFLLGMWLMTDGMKTAAGPALERFLANATRTRWRGLGSGILVTSIVQSSSAVTVAVIGFVNAGLLTLGQALWVLFGANVGTTMTGWLVAAAGAGIRIEAAALPLTGLGMLLHLAGRGRRLAALGMALAGFGVLFLGIDILKTGFAGLASQFVLPATSGALEIVLHVFAGIVLTILMQSSSAALVVALTAAQSGLLPLEAAGAVVIGANLGTTATAILAAIGATTNARRAAAAHVLFNLLTGVLAVLILPWLLHGVIALGKLLDLTSTPGTTLALFHTTFNLLGVLLMWPLTERLTIFLQRRFRSAEDDLARTKFLDQNLMAVPDLAVIALAREIERLGALAVGMLRGAMQGQPPGEVERHAQIVATLARTIGKFVAGLNRTSMGADTAVTLARLLRVLRYYASVGQLANALAINAKLPNQSGTGLSEPVRAWMAMVDEVGGQTLARKAGSEQQLERAMARIEAAYQELKGNLLQAGASAALEIGAMELLLQNCSLARRALQQAAKANKVMATLDAPLEQLMEREYGSTSWGDLP